MDKTAKQKFNIDDINRFYVDDMFYLIIGSLISADNLYTKESYEIAYEKLLSLLDGLPKSNLPDNDKQIFIDKINACINDIIKPEYKMKFNSEL